MFDEATRAWIYRGLVALILLAVIFGLLTEEQGGAIVAVIAGFFGVGLATVNTSTKRNKVQ